MCNLSELNRRAWTVVDKYLNIKCGPFSVAVPYHSNEHVLKIRSTLEQLGVPQHYVSGLRDVLKGKTLEYGWHQGKGTPEEIEESLGTLLDRSGLRDGILTHYGIVELMKFMGLGVDCSGFVYNVLDAAMSDARLRSELIESLNWQSEHRGASRAGAFVFAGKASYEIKAAEARPLDLILLAKDSLVTHVALVLGTPEGLMVAQASLTSNPTGVTVSSLQVFDGKPVFGGVAALGNKWESLYERGVISFRRLNCLHP